jgi:hypothetical protein
MSSAIGSITTPSVDASARNSMKSCSLMKPRAGASAVTMRSRSPTSGSAILCTRCGCSNGMVMLARLGPIMLRVRSSACVESSTESPISIVQIGPSAAAVERCGRSSLSRMTSAPSSRENS